MNDIVEARRPLSPHLSVYRPMLTMLMSIAHRITGAALYVGTLLLVWYLVAAASGEAAFATVSWFMRSFLGQLVLFGFTFAFLHHFFGGVRHLIWDAGYGFEHPMREKLAQGTLICSTILTLILFAVAHFLG
ncbi:MAG: succinate dehydrogenase, cytochrome b556 subunit [Methylovirgula sp.]